MTSPIRPDSQEQPIEPTNSIWNWLHRNGQALGAVVALIAIVGLLWGGGKLLFGSPDLAMTFDQTPLRMPSGLSADLTRSLRGDSTVGRLSDSTRSALANVLQFLNETDDFTTIKLTNTTSTSLQNVDVRISGVLKLGGWSVTGDYLSSQEQSDLLKLVKYDEPTDIVAIRGLPRMPPKSSLTIHLWGKVEPALLMVDPGTLVATYDGGAGKLVRTATVTGFDAFVYENGGILVALWIVTYLLTASAMTRHFEKQTPSAAKPNAANQAGPSVTPPAQ